jgi:hypothetical protein
MTETLTDEQRANKRYLVHWKLALSLNMKGANQTVHGKLSDIACNGATVLVENNLPAKSAVTAMFVIPPKVHGESPQTIQVSGKLIYCVLGGNGLFRAGIQFDSFVGQGLTILEKDLNARIPLSGTQ